MVDRAANKNWKMRALTLGSSLVLAASLVACGAQDVTSETESASSSSVAEQTSSAQSTTSESATKAVTTVGDTSSAAQKVTFTNGLSSDITSLSMRPSGQETWGENLLKSGESIASKAKVTLGYLPEEDAEAYDFLAVDAKGNNVEVDGVALSTMSELTLLSEGGTTYVTYIATDGSKGTTKADDAQEANSDGGSNEAASGGTTYEETYVEPAEEQTYSEPVAEAAAEPVAEVAAEPVAEVAAEPVAEQAPEQSGDACQGDVLLR